MAHRHPQDPEHGWKSAEMAGKLVAQGVLEARDIRDKIVEHAKERGDRIGDPDGFALRVLWHITDTAEHWRRERDKAEWLIRERTAPLIADWAHPEEILRAAHACNDELGSPLLRAEVRDVVGGELAAAVQKQSRVRRRAGRSL